MKSWPSIEKSAPDAKPPERLSRNGLPGGGSEPFPTHSAFSTCRWIRVLVVGGRRLVTYPGKTGFPNCPGQQPNQPKRPAGSTPDRPAVTGRPEIPFLAGCTTNRRPPDCQNPIKRDFGKPEGFGTSPACHPTTNFRTVSKDEGPYFPDRFPSLAQAARLPFCRSPIHQMEFYLAQPVKALNHGLESHIQRALMFQQVVEPFAGSEGHGTEADTVLG